MIDTAPHPHLSLASAMAPPPSALLSKSEIQYILAGCRDNCRADGRKGTDVRTHTIVTGGPSNSSQSSTTTPPLILCNGSARLLCDGTQLLCSIKADIVTPSVHRPHEGVVEIHVNQLIASQHVKARRALEDELQSSLESLLLEHLVDQRELCIVPHSYAWRLYVDLYIITATTSFGSLLDMASIVIRSALQHTFLPLVSSQQDSTSKQDATTDLNVDGDIRNAKLPPGVEQAPTIVTVTILPNNNSDASPILLLDASREEEVCALAQIHVTVAGPGSCICSLQLSGTKSLPLGILPQVTALALQASSQQIMVTKSSESMLLQPEFTIQ